MKIILSILLMLFGCIGQSDDCKCQKASDEVTTHWGQDSIIVDGEQTTRVLQGRILHASGAPLPEALVEVFEAPEGGLMAGRSDSSEQEKQRRIAACLTGEDGEVCFSELPSGKYELRCSKSGFNTYRALVDVNPKNAPDSFSIPLDVSK
jgi:hypothetical protein